MYIVMCILAGKQPCNLLLFSLRKIRILIPNSTPLSGVRLFAVEVLDRKILKDKGLDLASCQKQRRMIKLPAF